MSDVSNPPVRQGVVGGRKVRAGVQRVLIVDDSIAMQKLIGHALDSDPRLEVVGVAEDAYAARDMIKRLKPDVLVLDVEMPRMSGLDFLGRLMRLRPMPVVMFSSVTQSGSDAAIRALVLGAVDCIAKPQSGVTSAVLNVLADRVYAAATAPVLVSTPDTDRPATQARTAPGISRIADGQVILIGASTGGVTAVETVLRGLPPSIPPVLIAQHMPETFLQSFSSRLDSILPHRVSLAQDGMELRPGQIVLAPGGTHHTGIEARGGSLYCKAIDRPKRNGHCPSVDELFLSAEKIAPRVTAVILTGLGRDGADGLQALRNAGAHCIGQDEASCVVYGMPRAAAECGALDQQLPLSQIPGAVLASLRNPARSLRKA